MMQRGVDYGACDNCGCMYDLQLMKDYGRLNGSYGHDSQELEGQVCWNGNEHCHTFTCQACGTCNDTQIEIT